LAVGYFGFEGKPAYLDLVPLEYFDEAIAWLQRQEQVLPGGIVVYGVSKGAELALVLASRKEEIRGVIAFAPSSVVWQALPTSPPPRSGWAAGGQGLPFVPYDLSGAWSGEWSDLVTLYRNSLKQTEAVEKAAIEVEKICGPVLLLSGTEDTILPAAEMGGRIAKRLEEAAFPHRYDNVVYPNAGHTLTEHYIMGGTKEGNRAARIDSTERIARFLRELQESSAATPSSAAEK
jgi:uncharacterized protein